VGNPGYRLFRRGRDGASRKAQDLWQFYGGFMVVFMVFMMVFMVVLWDTMGTSWGYH
jgi:hypothetical protein